MDFKQYAEQTDRHAKYPLSIRQHLVPLVYTGLGVGGEGGEAADQVKKIMRDGKISNERATKLLKELGDVMWYVARCCTELQELQDEGYFDLGHDINMNLVAEWNIEKLDERLAKDSIKDESKR